MRGKNDKKVSLAKINQEYEEIMLSDLSSYEKDVKLAELMTKMEGTFQAPLIRDVEWEKRNRAVIAMYRKISMSRKFE